MSISNNLAVTDSFYMYNYGDLGFGLQFTDAAFADLTSFPIDLVLVFGTGNTVVATYSIAAGVTSNAYMTKAANLLYIGPVLTLVKPLAQVKDGYKLVGNITLANGKVETFKVINIHARKY